MSTVRIDPLLHRHHHRQKSRYRPPSKLNSFTAIPRKLVIFNGRSFCNLKLPMAFAPRPASSNTATVETSASTADFFFKETFLLRRTEMAEGKIFVRLEQGKDAQNWVLTVKCSLPGKWVLHWGVSHIHDVGIEWDQPPSEMRPPGSTLIKDYAVETPLKKSSSSVGGDTSHEVKIHFELNSAIVSINFILKDEETGAWYQHKGRDFKVPVVGYLQEDANVGREKNGLGIWSGALGRLSNLFMKGEPSHSKDQDRSIESKEPQQKARSPEEFYEELPFAKEIAINNSVTVSVRKCPETAKNLLFLNTDLPDHVVVHWGVCRDDAKRWEIPAAPYPPETVVFNDKALRTRLQQKEGGNGCWGLFTLEEGLAGFLFVFKLNESSWLKCGGKDFYVPLSSSSNSIALSRKDQSEGAQVRDASAETIRESSFAAHTNGIIDEIRNLVSDISTEKRGKTKFKEARENILQEIEKLAAEAYSMFRSTTPSFTEEAISETEELKPAVKICSGTGTGFEILCQGFNWESHKSGRWYKELISKATELSSLGFTVIWLPPPTDSVSPEGYMPTDLYNLNSRYGNIDELKETVSVFHKVGIKVLGDAVLNHRCAEHQNKNGVWNIFGGRLNWDARAVVADDPHFQGRGNKSSGECFHAAPNIDHSQDFVRKDIKEWLNWLRQEIGYDGWRLDFVRGFWGGYVKDYIDASEPYFSVGEYWDSLSYTYGEMDHNQDAHRQRIVDWINATNGSSGAFDVTTKGILHEALKKCEYWRLSDQKGKPPGVLGWWPSRAVTFIENHDTGSTQGHWRFPNGKELQGYAYILTHPGTPTVFYDHIFSHFRSEIAALISVRKRNKINCRSRVEMTKVDRDVYAAIIDEKVAVKIGPGHYEPPTGQKWTQSSEGRDYKVWEAS